MPKSSSAFSQWVRRTIPWCRLTSGRPPGTATAATAGAGSTTGAAGAAAASAGGGSGAAGSGSAMGSSSVMKSPGAVGPQSTPVRPPPRERIWGPLLHRRLLEDPAVVEPQRGQATPPGAAAVEADHPVLLIEVEGGPVAEDHPHAGALAAGDREPGGAPLRRLGRRTAELGAHAAVLAERAQAGEAGERGAGTVPSLEPGTPALGRLLLDCRDQPRRPLPAQRSLDLPRQPLGLLGAPGREEAGVDHQPVPLAVHER